MRGTTFWGSRTSTRQRASGVAQRSPSSLGVNSGFLDSDTPGRFRSRRWTEPSSARRKATERSTRRVVTRGHDPGVGAERWSRCVGHEQGCRHRDRLDAGPEESVEQQAQGGEPAPTVPDHQPQHQPAQAPPTLAPTTRPHSPRGVDQDCDMVGQEGGRPHALRRRRSAPRLNRGRTMKAALLLSPLQQPFSSAPGALSSTPL